MGRGHTDRRSGGWAEGCDGSLNRGEGRDAKVGGSLGGGGGVGIDDGVETDGVAGLLELAIDAQVMASEDAGTGDEDAEGAGQNDYLVGVAAGASTAWRHLP